MDPWRNSAAGCSPRLPRTRGDGPSTRRCCPVSCGASPHTRGWTLVDREREPLQRGFPAHAGMDPALALRRSPFPWLPRTRGDGPSPILVTRFRSKASPHTRGWTRSIPARRQSARGFPAHAGMDPGFTADVQPHQRLPRTRGDGPAKAKARTRKAKASPHTRGWTREIRIPGPGQVGFPAHAGMDPDRTSCRSTSDRLPRTRGDGPFTLDEAWSGGRASPHTRGWTFMTAAPAAPWRGFPAHAGMDPVSARLVRAAKWLPRTRGDGPVRNPSDVRLIAASPHTRGWT